MRLIILAIGSVLCLTSAGCLVGGRPPAVDSSEIARSEPELREFTDLVGWAYSAWPGTDKATMRADMARMREGGANAVYISHANPGEPDDDIEPGMTFSVYYARVHHTAPHAQADAQYLATHAAVQAADEAGLAVVLAVGYQIQMGREWNALHEAHLRRDADGARTSHWGSGETASPYSPLLRSDLTDYYRWINAEFVEAYPHIVALNLADEPMGADYSNWAQEEFHARHGVSMDDADAAMIGEFASGMLADWAVFTAGTWAEINPTIWTTMTFHIQRDNPWFPDFEAIFARAPRNFVFSADTHYHDGPGDVPTLDIGQLAVMIRTLGWYSAVYERPLLLWTSANAWGLTPQGGIPEADVNLRLVEEESRRNGGRLAMIMAWGYNIRYQGVFGSEGSQIGFDPEEMFSHVSGAMAALRSGLSDPGDELPARAMVIDRPSLMAWVGERRLGHITGPVLDMHECFGPFLQSNTVLLVDGEAARWAAASGAQIARSTFAHARANCGQL
ncbi:MAG: hypothetical protein GEU73_06155 [Chloroflexi bacterium]|nr:hypothetical protein [Chloroflexota bacterium]